MLGLVGGGIKEWCGAYGVWVGGWWSGGWMLLDGSTARLVFGLVLGLVGGGEHLSIHPYIHPCMHTPNASPCERDGRTDLLLLEARVLDGPTAIHPPIQYIHAYTSNASRYEKDGRTCFSSKRAHWPRFSGRMLYTDVCTAPPARVGGFDFDSYVWVRCEGKTMARCGAV